MKRLLSAVLVAALLASNCAVNIGTTVKAEASQTTKNQNTQPDAGVYVEKIDNLSSDFIMGADVSSVLSLEQSGVKFYDWDGVTEQDMFVTMAQSGINWVRIRIWNDPYTKEKKGYGAGNTDVEKAITMAKRAQAAGLKILLNFHYSDFWAHPSVQTVPKAWANFTVEERAQAIYTYTTDSLNAMKAAGITSIGMVQIGNETTTRFCGTSDWSEMAKMFKSGCKAVKDFDPSIKTAIHFTDPERTSTIKQLADGLYKENVDYDVFATSYYTFWHGTLENLQDVLNYVADTYGKEVMVAETSWVWTLDNGDEHPNNVGTKEAVAKYGASIQAQASALREVMNVVANVNGNKGLGTFYWEPAWLPVPDDSRTGGLSRKEKWNTYGSGWASAYAKEYSGYEAYYDVANYWGGASWENHSLFDWNGVPMESLKTYQYVYTGTRTNLPVSSVENPTVSCKVGDSYSLPSKVSVQYEGVKGINSKANVSWDASDVAKVNLSKPGTYTVQGTLEGITSIKATCTINVYVDTIVSVKDSKTTIGINETVSYPSTIEATYYSGDVKQLPITWNQEEIKKVSTKRAGTYVVSGTVNGWDKKVNLYISVESKNLVSNGSFEETNNAWGNVRELPNWTLSSSVGTSITWPIYSSPDHDTVDGARRLAVWSDQFDGYNAEAYQEVNIADTGDGEYTVSLKVKGNLENAVAYIKSGKQDGTILKEVSLPKTNDWTAVSFKADVDHVDTITIGCKASNIKKNQWLAIDQVSAKLTSKQESLDTLQQLVDSTKNYSNETCNIADASYISFETAKVSAEAVLANNSSTEAEKKAAYDALNQAVNSLQFKVNVASATNGTITASTAYAKKGQKVAISVQSDIHYDLKSFVVKADDLSKVSVSKSYTFTMPANAVEIAADFEKINLDTVDVTFHYYYEGTGKPALVFNSNKAGDANFTMQGRSGYFMTKDSSNQNWYTFHVKGSYGGFQLYEITAEQFAAGTATGNLVDSFGIDGKGEALYDTLVKGKSYYRDKTLSATIDGKENVLVSEIQMESTSKTVKTGETFTVPVLQVLPLNATNRAVTYASNNEKVATVNAATGLVTAKCSGITTIKVTAADDSEVTAAFTVIVSGTMNPLPPVNPVEPQKPVVTPNPVPTPVVKVTSISLNDTKKTLTIGQKYQVKLKSILPQNASNKAVSYTSNKPSIAAVDQKTGIVTAKAEGSAVITVKAADGSNCSTKVTLTVKKKQLSTPKVSVVSGYKKKVSFKWNKVTNAAKYNVYVNGKKVTTTTKTTYSYTKVSAGKTYKVQVVAVPKDIKKYSNSAKSKTLSVKCLKSTSTIKAASKTKKKATVTWKKVDGASGYEVVRSTNKSSGFKQVKTVNSKTVKLTDTSVKSKKTYYYKVRAYKVYNGKKVYGQYSKVVKVKVK